MHRRSYQKGKAGFTLIETLVALTVLITAVTSMVALISRGLADVKTSKNRLIALNLAREGLELTRVVREHNKMCDRWDNDAMDDSFAWDTDSDGVGTIRGSNQRVDATDWPSSEMVTCTLAPLRKIQNPNFQASCAIKLKLDASGRYGYLSGPDTLFQRCIDIHHPPGLGEDGIPKTQMLNVASTVIWEERGVTQSVTLRERFYNWK